MIKNLVNPKLVKGFLAILSLVIATSLVLIPSVKAVEIVVDDLDAGYSDTGWAISGSGPYHFAPTGDGSEIATFTPTVPSTGLYEVFVSWYIHPNRATDAPYTVNHVGGSDTFDVNQQLLADGTSGADLDPSGWYSLGQFSFNAGTSGTIVLTNDANGYVIADQVRLVSVDQSGSISGMKFEDVNGNGVKDEGEEGLAGWKIRLRDPNNGNVIIASATTDGDGNYTFANVAAGDYRLTEKLESGWTRTLPTSPNRYDVTLESGEDLTGYDFGNFQNAELSGMKFEDLNGDGIKDVGEPGLEGFTIELHLGASLVATTTTNLAGAYAFADLGPGTYTISEIQQGGWVQTAPTSTSYSVTPESGESITGLDFGNRQSNVINALKYEDMNADGAYDASDTPIENWQINLYDGEGNLLDVEFTDALGMAVFTDLDAGDYVVEEENQVGWIASTPTTTAVTLIGNGDVEDVEFGNYQFGTIRGKKFEDLNGDGIKDNGEPHLSGWVIRLELDGLEIASTTTGGNGLYVFEDLMPGNYEVYEVLQGGWQQTAPADGFYAVTLKSGQTKAGRHFGNQRISGISGMKYNDVNGNGEKDENEPGIAGWTIRLRDLGTDVVVSTTTDAYGYYSFNNISAGNYRVSEKQEENWQQTSTPNKYDLTVEPGDFHTNIDFGNFRLGEIHGVKYEDMNGNGYYESGEPLLSGWEIELYDGDGLLLATTTTDLNGEYYFDGLFLGDYALREVMQDGWGQSEPGPNTNYQHEFSIEQGGTYGTDANFGNYHPATFSGYKYRDENLNGQYDSGEERLPGWTIIATHLFTGDKYTDVTNANGRYKFEDIRPGIYLVREVPQDNWLFTEGPLKQVEILSGETLNNIDFGNNEIGAFLNSVSPFAAPVVPVSPLSIQSEPASPSEPEVENIQEEEVNTNSVARFTFPELSLPKISLPSSLSNSSISLPKITMPKFEMPSFFRN